ncbi:hypothetical protein BCAR13_1410007 [Paraburkholderia caribensis]|nr:hypothetical protein BCAR13_1410007 [Paraburkholderia caribensis]
MRLRPSLSHDPAPGYTRWLCRRASGSVHASRTIVLLACKFSLPDAKKRLKPAENASFWW